MAAGTHVGKVLVRMGDGDRHDTSAGGSHDIAGGSAVVDAEAKFTPPSRSTLEQGFQHCKLPVQVVSSPISDPPALYPALQCDIPTFCPTRPERDSYLIIGGLGGFGLELAKFLAERGCRKLILSSRSSVRSGQQTAYLETIATNYNCSITVTNLDFTDRNAVRKFLKHNRGHLAGIFNLGLLLADGLFQNITPEQWVKPLLSKTVITYAPSLL